MVKYKQLYHNKKDKIINQKKIYFYIFEKVEGKKGLAEEYYKKGGNINAHHLKQFALIMKENNIETFEQAMRCEELWNINNGITLCEECHKFKKDK